MSEKKSSPAQSKSTTRSADRKSSAGTTPDPWDVCAKLEYGADRSFAWSVREQVIAAPADEKPRVEERLLKSLAQPGVTEAGRAFLCQMLAMVGSAKSVPVLTPLLKDPKSTEAARYALQMIPGAEASAALRDALGALTGPAKAGLIGSIAMRRDAGARSALSSLKSNSAEPAIVREAAGRALEHLESVKA